jgi:hypothetical protein
MHKTPTTGDLITPNQKMHVGTIYLYPTSPDQDPHLTQSQKSKNTLNKNEVGIITQICPIKEAYAHIITKTASGWVSLTLLTCA